MYEDVNGVWVIAAQILPVWVREMQIEFNELIKGNENED